MRCPVTAPGRSSAAHDGDRPAGTGSLWSARKDRFLMHTLTHTQHAEYLRADGVSAVYGDRRVLTDVSLTVAPGHAWA